MQMKNNNIAIKSSNFSFDLEKQDNDNSDKFQQFIKAKDEFDKTRNLNLRPTEYEICNDDLCFQDKFRSNY